MQSTRDVRFDVERVIDLYLAIDYFSTVAIQIGNQQKPESFTVQPEREKQLWKSTIGLKLKHLSTKHEQSLLKGADWRRTIPRLENQIRNLDAVLGSPSAAFTISSHRATIVDLRDIMVGMREVLNRERIGQARGRLYTEAVMLFWMVLTESPDVKLYCLAPVEEEKRRRLDRSA